MTIPSQRLTPPASASGVPTLQRIPAGLCRRPGGPDADVAPIARRLDAVSLLALLVSVLLPTSGTIAAQTVEMQPWTVPAIHHLAVEEPVGYYIENVVLCPAQVRVTMSAPPEGWTPSFSSITSAYPTASIEAIGGTQRLVCRYASSRDYFFHKPFPRENPQCRVLDSGAGRFGCRPAGPWLTATGYARLSGRLDLDGNWGYPTPADLQVIVVAGSNERFVRLERPRTRLAPAPDGDPTPASCERAMASRGEERVPLNGLTRGSRYCYQTTSSRFGVFEVVHSPRLAAHIIRYTTWAHTRSVGR